MGPLQGMKIVEIGGIGPGPFCAQMLSDMGADIIRIDRKDAGEAPINPKFNILHRNRRSIAVDLTKPEGIEAVLKIIEQVDALIEGFRPGVMEKLGLGPDICMTRNPKLVFGRMTGWGQNGPMAQLAGHDINYIALSGALHAMGRPGKKPVPPLNLVGDFGGGGMLLAFGIVCGVYETQKSGQGQVIDAAMVDGAATLMGMFYGMLAGGMWTTNPGTNWLDGGAHFYDTYETADGKWVAIGSIEPQFYALLLKYAGLDDPDFKNQMNSEKWPELKKKTEAIFKCKSRDEWCQIMENTDICFAPVLSMTEAMEHPHNVARKTFVEFDGVMQPAPAPRFSRTKPEIKSHPPVSGEHNETALADLGFSREEIKKLKSKGAI